MFCEVLLDFCWAKRGVLTQKFIQNYSTLCCCCHCPPPHPTFWEQPSLQSTSNVRVATANSHHVKHKGAVVKYMQPTKIHKTTRNVLEKDPTPMAISLVNTSVYLNAIANCLRATTTQEEQALRNIHNTRVKRQKAQENLR